MHLLSQLDAKYNLFASQVAFLKLPIWAYRHTQAHDGSAAASDEESVLVR